MVSSRDFKILWATNQGEKLEALYRDNKLALLYFKLFQKKSYWKILGIRLDFQLRKHGFLTQDEQSELKTLYKSDLLYKFLRLNDYVCSNDLFPATEAMRKSQEAFRIVTSRQKDFPVSKLFEKNAGASITVVGNAPIEEGNRNLRQKENIDASDIVVRFNKFQISSYEEHIGAKCSWLAMICNNYAGAEFPTILTDNPLFDYVDSSFIDQVLKTQLHDVYFIPQQDVVELAGQLQALPSSGVRLIYALHKHRASFRLFGFSFFNKENSSDSFEHYFEKKKHSEQYHSAQKEKAFLFNLLSEK